MNTKHLIAIVSAAGLALASQHAIAKGPSYTYAEIGYVHFDADKYDGNGAEVNISYGATEHIFVKLGYSRLFVDTDAVSSDIDIDQFNIGMGGHMSVTDNVDVLGVVSYVDREYSGGIPSEADEGYQVDLGVRGMVTKKAELNATASFRHMSQTSVMGVADDEDLGFEVGTVIKLKKKFHFSGNVNYFDEAEEVGGFIGIRLNL